MTKSFTLVPFNTVTIAITAVASIFFISCQQSETTVKADQNSSTAATAPAEPHSPPAAGQSSPPAADETSVPAAELAVNVGGSGFSPDSLTVKKGQPVRISFKRNDEPTCADEVVFPDLGIRKKLPANQTTVVELTPTKAGSLSFACGMDMMKGKLVVQ